MLFNSLTFFLFLPVVLLGHAVLRGRPLKVWMLAMSYVFYGWGHPLWYNGLLLTSTVLDYCMARLIDATDDPKARTAWLLVSLTGNLGLLGLFKYAGYVARLANRWGLDVVVPDLPLPIGISFYTFQTISYTIDVYRRQLKAEKDFVNMALFVAFFPQLVAGPIERAGRLLHQLAQKQRPSSEDVLCGFTRIGYGLMKKMVFADWLGLVVNQVYTDPGRMSTWDLLLGTYGFAFQIYLDFSAYSDIAVGLARVMGIQLMENFRSPYLSRNISEYWQRWHISLSTWLRDYLYVPLGGSRKGARRTILNIFLVMLLGGLWHGAANTFILWGLWIGLGLTLYHVYRALVLKGQKEDKERPLAWSDALWILVTFHWMLVSYVFFRSASVSEAFQILKRFFCEPWGVVSFAIVREDVIRSVLFMAIAGLAHWVHRTGIWQRWVNWRSPVLTGALWGLMVVIIVLMFAPTQQQFIYFQF